VENWNTETVGGMIHTEIDLYKSAKGLKLIDQETGMISNPLDWRNAHQSDLPYLVKSYQLDIFQYLLPLPHLNLSSPPLV